MGMITSIRPALPVAEAPAPSAVQPRPQGLVGTASPVESTLLEQAVQHIAPKPATADPQLMTARASAEYNATAAAEAARRAYIKASIAAGVSPLPLP